MIRTIVTGSSGFIGSRLLQKVDARPLAHEDIHSCTYQDYDRFFFLSTYGNMAHHKDQGMMVNANVSDLIFVLTNYFDGWMCYMSSSSVLLPVQTSYSRTKRAGEEILQSLPIRSCIVRPYSVTGVGEQREHLIPTLIRSCMTSEEMPFDPEPVHDFVDVYDVVDALIYCADNKITGIVELGNCFGIPNHVIREMVEHFCQKKANVIEQTKVRSYDNLKWYCKNSPDWFKPRKAISQSIEEMVVAYKNDPKTH